MEVIICADSVSPPVTPSAVREHTARPAARVGGLPSCGCVQWLGVIVSRFSFSELKAK